MRRVRLPKCPDTSDRMSAHFGGGGASDSRGHRRGPAGAKSDSPCTGRRTSRLRDRTFRPLSASVLDFERRGHVVRSAEDDGRTHEIEATTRDGRRIEAIVEAATVEVLSERADD